MEKTLTIAQVMENEFEYSNELFNLFDEYGGKPYDNNVWDTIEKKGITIKNNYRHKLSNKNLDKIYNDFDNELFFNRFHSALSLLQERFSKSTSFDELNAYKNLTNQIYHQYKNKLNFQDDRLQYLYNITNFIYKSNEFRLLYNIIEK